MPPLEVNTFSLNNLSIRQDLRMHGILSDDSIHATRLCPSSRRRSPRLPRGGMLRTTDALRLGIHPRTLYALRDAGEIEAVGRGLCRLATAPPLTAPDFIAIALLVPRAVICLVSALAHHRLTTQIPHAVDVALPSHGCHSPARLLPTVLLVRHRKDLVRWCPRAHLLGGEKHRRLFQVPQQSWP